MSSSKATAFDQDFYAWTQEQAAALRRAAADRVNLPIDWENLAEEVDSMGRSERHELANRLRVLLAHLLKWLYATDIRGRCLRPWRLTIDEQRDQIRGRLAESPSLNGHIAAIFEDTYKKARRIAADEAEADIRSFPPDPPFSLDEALDPAYPPDLFPPEWRG